MCIGARVPDPVQEEQQQQPDSPATAEQAEATAHQQLQPDSEEPQMSGIIAALAEGRTYRHRIIQSL